MTYNFHTTIFGILFGLGLAQVLWLSIKSYCINTIHEFNLFWSTSGNRNTSDQTYVLEPVCEAMIRLP